MTRDDVARMAAEMAECPEHETAIWEAVRLAERLLGYAAEVADGAPAYTVTAETTDTLKQVAALLWRLPGGSVCLPARPRSVWDD